MNDRERRGCWALHRRRGTKLVGLPVIIRNFPTSFAARVVPQRTPVPCPMRQASMRSQSNCVSIATITAASMQPLTTNATLPNWRDLENQLARPCGFREKVAGARNRRGHGGRCYQRVVAAVLPVRLSPTEPRRVRRRRHRPRIGVPCAASTIGSLMTALIGTDASSATHGGE